MTADDYDTVEAASPTAGSGAVGGTTGAVPAALRDDRIGDTADGSDGIPKTVVETSLDDTEERLYV